ncbi:hypothetical protein [Micromonospora okii]|uniref:hypothetical protein n=1 Tax=Micromonospora okii TaxID=1182970 RepID=UPI001E29099C|nr:hypothetical protein [Micromonospora okii]
MKHRDSGRGDDSPREGQPSVPFDAFGSRAPTDPHRSDAERHGTPSRRRAARRGQREPDETYLPRWAVESGVGRADGRGRHAAPEDDDDPPYRSGSAYDSSGTAGEWRRVGEAARWGALPAGGAAGSEHTAGWRAFRDAGYVGSRRAESSEDDRVPGPMSESPGRPSVPWSGRDATGSAGSGTSDPDAVGPGPGRGVDGWSTGRSRRAGAESGFTRPAVDPPGWGVAGAPAAGAEAVTHRPAVDPWDASGVHAWRRSGVEGGWESPSDPTALDGTGAFARYRGEGPGRRGRGDAPQAGWDTTEERPWPEHVEEFWFGSRLAGDDPRWMGEPDSAPRSQVAHYAAPRPGAETRPEPERRPGAESGSGSLPGGGDELPGRTPGGPLRSLAYTAACYLFPAVLVLVWLLTLSGEPPAGCVTAIGGGGCDSPRSHVLGSLGEGLPRFGLALAGSLVVALLLRRVGTPWRPATVAVAAAVVGGGLSTLMISVATGQPLG